MRFSALPVLMDENVHCAPVLENRTIRLIRLNSQKGLQGLGEGKKAKHDR
jgi:hypothetical protein